MSALYVVGQEMLLESERPELKASLVAERLGTDNPLTKRPHSAESAENAARVDERYLKHLGNQSRTVMEKNNALTYRDSAYLRASLAIALVKATAGVV